MNKTESLLTRRYPETDIKTESVSISQDKSTGSPEGCVGGVRRIGGMILFWAFLWNCGNQSSEC